MEDILPLITNYKNNNVARRLRTKDAEITELRIEIQCLKDKILNLEGGLLHE